MEGGLEVGLEAYKCGCEGPRVPKFRGMIDLQMGRYEIRWPIDGDIWQQVAFGWRRRYIPGGLLQLEALLLLSTLSRFSIRAFGEKSMTGNWGISR